MHFGSQHTRIKTFVGTEIKLGSYALHLDWHVLLNVQSRLLTDREFEDMLGSEGENVSSQQDDEDEEYEDQSEVESEGYTKPPSKIRKSAREPKKKKHHQDSVSAYLSVWNDVIKVITSL